MKIFFAQNAQPEKLLLYLYRCLFGITNDKQIDLCLEQICQEGCRSVNQVIEQLEQQQMTEATRQLNSAQQRIVLQELKKIMAVYAETQSCEVS